MNIQKQPYSCWLQGVRWIEKFLRRPASLSWWPCSVFLEEELGSNFRTYWTYYVCHYLVGPVFTTCVQIQLCLANNFNLTSLAFNLDGKKHYTLPDYFRYLPEFFQINPGIFVSPTLSSEISWSPALREPSDPQGHLRCLVCTCLNPAFLAPYPPQIYWSFLSSHQALPRSCFPFSRKTTFSSSSSCFSSSSSPSPSHPFSFSPSFSWNVRPPRSTGAQGPGSWPFYLPWRPKELFQVFCLPPVLYINKPPATLRLHRLLENISFMV